MMSREDILAYARTQGIDPFMIENDYLQHIALTCMYSEFSNELVFKGGTALQKLYGLNRLSRDLDFNLIEGDDEFKLSKVVKRISDYYTCRIAAKQKVKHGIGYKLQIEGPSFEATGIRHILPITINKEEKPLLKPEFKTINPGIIYKDPDLHAYSLLVMNIKEITAEKVRALLTRREAMPRDLYDLWFLLSNNFTIDTDLVNKKMQFDHAIFSTKRLKARIKEIKPRWEADLKPLTKILPSYEEASKIVLQAFV